MVNILDSWAISLINYSTLLSCCSMKAARQYINPWGGYILILYLQKQALAKTASLLNPTPRSLRGREKTEDSLRFIIFQPLSHPHVFVMEDDSWRMHGDGEHRMTPSISTSGWAKATGRL